MLTLAFSHNSPSLLVVVALVALASFCLLSYPPCLFVCTLPVIYKLARPVHPLSNKLAQTLSSPLPANFTNLLNDKESFLPWFLSILIIVFY
jgi:hypothetical protein